MSITPQEHLVATFRRTGGTYIRGLIYASEFVNKVFDEFAATKQVYSDLVPTLWELVPEGVRSTFRESIHRALQPVFHWHPFYIGGGRPATEEELRRDAELHTGRIRAWALEFARLVD